MKITKNKSKFNKYYFLIFLLFLITGIIFIFFYIKNSQVSYNKKTNSTVATSAVFEWFQKPAAIRYVGKFDRTYISWVTINGQIQMRYYDNKANIFSPIYTVDDLLPQYKTEAQDDHNAPSLLILPTGRILIFYVVHDINNAFFVKESTNIEDISTWSERRNITDPEANIPYNYPQAKILDNGNILLFYRRGVFYNSNEYFKISKDDGATWGKPIDLINFGNEGIYAVAFSQRNTIHVAWNEAVPTPPRKNIYYAYSPDGGITWEKRNKTILNLPITKNSADKVFESSNDPASVWDIVADNQNNPFIAFSYKNDPNNEFRFAQWQDNSWITNTITKSSLLYDKNNFFSGGIVIDPKNIYNVYLSKKREYLEIEKWSSFDKGKTWRQTETITKNSDVDNFRLQLVENYSDKLKLVWNSGLYEGLINNEWSGFSKVNIQSDAPKIQTQQ